MTPRSVVFDGYWLVDGPPSGRSVMDGLIRGWHLEFPDDTVTVVLPRGARSDAVTLPDSIQTQYKRPTIRNHGVWTLSGFENTSAGVDATISHNFSPLIRRRGTRQVTFLHDAIFRSNPEWFTPAERAYLGVATFSLRKADIILTSSRSELSRIERTIPGLQGRVHAVGLAPPLAITRIDRGMAHVPAEEKYILAVGRINVRKNLERLIDAYLVSGLQDHQLIIVGAPDGRSGDGRDAARPGVTFTGPVSDEDLASLYRNCSFFVFPSLDEGFGLPLVEAAYFGAPSAASDIAPFREIGLADQYFDPYSVTSISRSLQFMARAEIGRSREIRFAESLPTWSNVASNARLAIFGES